jgi:hypothetical protein
LDKVTTDELRQSKPISTAKNRKRSPGGRLSAEETVIKEKIMAKAVTEREFEKT